MNIGRLLVAVGLLVTVVGPGPASAATLDSARTWGGPRSELVEGTAVAADGSVYVAGTTFSFGAGNNDIFLVKYDAGGALAWQRTWGQPGEFLGDSAGDVAVAADGSAYVVGTAVTVSNDVVLLKFGADGTLLWQRTWGGPSLDTGDAVAVGPDGSVYVAGTTESFSDREAFVVKFTADGSVVWQQTWSRGESDSAQALAVDAAGTVYVGATSFRPIFLFDAALLELSPEGVLLSETGYAVGESADVLGVAVAPDDSAYLVGSLDGAASAFVVKLTPERTLAWERAVGGRSGDRANAAAVAADGTLWVAGETNTEDASDEAFVVQMSAERGRMLQQNTWGGVQIEHGIDVGFAPDGDVIVGAIAQAPPWQFLDSKLKGKRLHGALVELGGTTSAVQGTLGVPNGVITVPAGSETFGGESDAAVLRITP
jgi:uncharacterized delta-60 repeat protein